MLKLLKSSLLLSVFLLPLSSLAQYDEGKQYRVLDNPINTVTGDKVEVREVFWYGCPHCFSLEDDIYLWKQSMPAEAEFIKMPAPLSGNWTLHARMFYTLESLGKIDELHEKMFDAFHLDHKLHNESDFLDFAEANGLDRDLVEETMDSFGVETLLGNAKQILSQAQLSGVPAFIIAGKYVTSPSMAGGEKAVFGVVDYLVAKESKGMSVSSSATEQPAVSSPSIALPSISPTVAKFMAQMKS